VIDLEAVNHANRELELMLVGRKPLAVFSEELSFLPDEELIPEEAFSRYVASGKFVRGEAVIPGPYSQKPGRETKLKNVLFALKEEEWRINAMLLLLEQHAKTMVWNETCERIECALLGYTDEETDAWCKKAFPKQALSQAHADGSAKSTRFADR
jgi:hypothetical protein